MKIPKFLVILMYAFIQKNNIELKKFICHEFFGVL